MASGTTSLTITNDNFVLLNNGSSTPQYLGFTLGAGQTLTNLSFDLLSAHRYWRDATGGSAKNIVYTIYVCDSAGNNATNIGTVTIPGSGNSWGNSATKSFSFSVTNLRGKAVYLKATCSSNRKFQLFGDSACTLTYTYSTASHPTVSAGDTITAAQMADLYFYKYGTSASPGQYDTIYPWIFGSRDVTLNASDYNNA